MLVTSDLVVSRAEWGAIPRHCAPAITPRRMTVHHTVTPNNEAVASAARVRQIQNYHIYTQGWCDVGYQFLVGQDGRVYQGTLEDRLGTHVAYENHDNVGISFMGTYASQRPSDAMWNAAAGIIRAIGQGYGIPISRTHVRGHTERAHPGWETSCPGAQVLHNLGDLVARAASGGCRSFAETGHEVCGRLLEYWEHNGGLPVFGYPVTPQREESGRQVQWFERARLERHPENGRPWDVLMGRLGAELKEPTWSNGYEASAPGPDCRFIGPEHAQGHYVCGAILHHWDTRGLDLGHPGLSWEERVGLFGYPISPEHDMTMADGTVRRVQWFERARLERHPENCSSGGCSSTTPNYILGGRLGCETGVPGC